MEHVVEPEEPEKQKIGDETPELQQRERSAEVRAEVRAEVSVVDGRATDLKFVDDCSPVKVEREW